MHSLIHIDRTDDWLKITVSIARLMNEWTTQAFLLSVYSDFGDEQIHVAEGEISFFIHPFPLFRESSSKGTFLSRQDEKEERQIYISQRRTSSEVGFFDLKKKKMLQRSARSPWLKRKTSFSFVCESAWNLASYAIACHVIALFLRREMKAKKNDNHLLIIGRRKESGENNKSLQMWSIACLFMTSSKANCRFSSHCVIEMPFCGESLRLDFRDVRKKTFFPGFSLLLRYTSYQSSLSYSQRVERRGSKSWDMYLWSLRDVMYA